MSKPIPLAPLDEAQRYTLAETTRYLRTSRTSLYLAIRAGKLKAIRQGSRVYIPGSEIARLSQAAS